jgi:hypothetical protein
MRSPYCLCPPLVFFVCYADRVVSKESKRLVLLRTSCLIRNFTQPPGKTLYPTRKEFAQTVKDLSIHKQLFQFLGNFASLKENVTLSFDIKISNR